MRSTPWCIFGFFFAFVLSCAAPATGDLLDVSKLQGRWILESINGTPVESEQEIYFEIDGQIIRGFDGCNTFGGRLDAPTRLRMTQRECVSAGPMLPLELPDARSQLKAGEVAGEKLTLPLSGEAGQAGFVRRPLVENRGNGVDRQK